MLVTSLQYDAATATLVVADHTAPPPAGAAYAVLHYGPDGWQPVATSPTSPVAVPVGADGPYVLKLQARDAETGVVLDEGELLVQLVSAELDRQLSALCFQHASRPQLLGPDRRHRELWVRRLHLRGVLAEGNAPVAQALTPAATGGARRAGQPLPPAASWLQAGTYHEVAPAGNALVVLVDVAAGTPLTATATRRGQDVPLPVTVTAGIARQRIAVEAAADGLYEVVVRSAGYVVARLLVPVHRTAGRQLREDVRALAPQFSQRLALSDNVQDRLALLRMAEAAARTGQADLAQQLLAAAEAVPGALSPTSIYPHHG